MAFDVLIEKGTVVDGTGAVRFQADVGVSGGKIEAVGSLAGSEAARRIDAAGHIVAPGFIDMHSHSDITLLYDPGGESKAHQGVTTEVVGNCGSSPFPAGRVTGAELQEEIDLGNGQSTLEWDWTDLDGWANALEANGVSVNIAPQVGHSTLRVAAGALDDRPPTADELKYMQHLAAMAVEQGAFSLSTGLTVTPSSYAATDEIVALCEAIAPYEHAFYVSHARVWAGNHVGAVEECVEIGRRTGIPAQYSHMAIIDSRAFGHGEELTSVIDQARDEGVDATYDVYPYTAAGTHLHQMVPEWLQEGGVAAMVARLREPATRKRAIDDTAMGFFRGLPWVWDSMVISYVNPGTDTGIIGKNVQEIAEGRNEEPVETFLALIDENEGAVGCVAHNRVEGDIRYFLGHPQAMIGSDGNAISPDGVYGADIPHPRFYGTYPRILGRYVREQPAVLTLEDAVWKMTGFPAQRLGLRDRGVISEGNAADLVVFDPETVIDNATFEDPHRYPEGIPHVLVRGVPIVLDGRHTGERLGRVLRRGE